jgi:hypothetical protein
MAGALFLVFALWNPSGFSWTGWVMRAPDFTASMAVTGIALLIGLIAASRIAFTSLGLAGAAAGILAGAVTLLSADKLGVLPLHVALTEATVWLGLAAIGLGLGLSWARLQQRLSGERSVLKDPP